MGRLAPTHTRSEVTMKPWLHQEKSFGAMSQGSIGRHKPQTTLIGMIGQIILVGQIVLVGRMMDIYCLGGKTWLVCGPKEAKLGNIPFWKPLRGPVKGVLDSLGFLSVANQ